VVLFVSEPDWLKRLRSYFGGKIPGVEVGLEMARRSLHGVYVKAAALRLKDMGLRVISVEHPDAREIQDVSDEELRYHIAPSLGLSYGDIARHDVVALTQQRELVIVEVQRNEQIVEAARKAKRVILVIPGLESGSKVIVWGDAELKPYLDLVSSQLR